MIRSKRKTYEKAIKELEESSKKLRNMIKRIEKRKIPKSVIGKGFRSLKGHLPWPVSGRVLIPFGKYKDPEFKITVFKNGIEIKPKAREKPKAVAGGRVVYADWFKGYGLLLIIDHGSGYHSLYGNLAEIYLDTGDIIVKGTAVGKTGKSRLLNVHTLYFEIRHKGKPLDPMKWLKRKIRIKRRIK
jgi:septal ring factor EnvC (AmiA/AmiB activator)